MKRIGLDFGSCYIKCAYANKDRLINLDKDSGGESKARLRNIVTYYPDAEPRVGNVSLNDNKIDSIRVNSIKTVLSERDWHISVGEKNITASQVTSDILKSVYNKIHLTDRKEDDLHVIATAPVCFSERQRKIIQLGAENAGFTVESMITEPFAALFFLMQDNMDDEHKVLVVDIGGSTLDLCLVSISHTNGHTLVTTESTTGMNFGGIDINNGIIDKILKPKYQNVLKPHLDPNTTNAKRAMYYRNKLFSKSKI